MKTIKMKFIIPVMIMGVFSYNAMAQRGKQQVPQSVQAAFSARYPQADLKKWETKNNQYIAYFIMDKNKGKATYGTDGNWLKTETNMKISKLPSNIRASIRGSKYASYTIDNLENMQTPARTMYAVTLDNHSGNPTYENAGSSDNETLYFSRNGRMLKSVNNNNE